MTLLLKSLRLLLLIPVLAFAQAALAVEPDDGAGSEVWTQSARERISNDRAQAEQRFAVAETACWRYFAVNDCIRHARADRRAVLDMLRREELALNQLDRQRRTKARLTELRGKAAPEKTTK